MEENYQASLQEINRKHIVELNQADVKFAGKLAVAKKEAEENLEKRELQLNRLKLKEQ